MINSIIVVAVVVVLWALCAARMHEWRIAAPVLVVFAGIAMGFTTRNSIAETLNTQVALRVAEIILAVLLFVDATEVRGGLLGRDPKSALRILFIALPLSLAFAVLLGGWLLPGASWAVLLVIACVVVPTDFAPAATLVRDERIPARVRDLLTVESGYNDGIVSPIFLAALVLAGDHTHAESVGGALQTAVPSAVKAVVAGLVVGLVLAYAMNIAERRELSTEQSQRIALVAAPLLSYAASVAVHGNGFVAAFVCGLVVNVVRQSAVYRRELELLDDLGFLLTVGMWFVFGSVAVYAIAEGPDWRMPLFCLAALTLVRIVPVLLAMIGSRFGRRERLLLGVLGPRGTTSIVFGLLAFNVLAIEDGLTVISAMTVTVLGSVLLHGIGGPVAALTRLVRADR
ncbi:cation:proton antiporter domain-containing protein [Nocardia pseudobrasiliensis]|uniref:Sodium/proton antiporter (CPA1 family) n=1 Tax=Nocardia pseudobrasiliensis TaxID=45979 RepID=A0A370IDR9_9NOCA|nr:cation:proton antiporter [Nocardia pseudobrasiliensis]RDI67574.1 sodium/proton antiporter (CPA1 family) [Nocardia pseudobrasiliensis]